MRETKAICLTNRDLSQITLQPCLSVCESEEKSELFTKIPDKSIAK